jgi:hypothetical protein
VGSVVEEADPKAANCQCGQIAAPRLYAERGRCVILCDAPIARKHVFCRPCAKGNHTGLPCKRYVREGVYHFTSTRTCASCGIDSALHEEGSDGSPIGE